MVGSRHEDTVGDAGVQVHVVVERRAEAVAGEMPPSRGRDARGVSASGVPPDAPSRSRSISARKIFVSAATARGRSARGRTALAHQPASHSFMARGAAGEGRAAQLKSKCSIGRFSAAAIFSSVALDGLSFAPSIRLIWL